MADTLNSQPLAESPLWAERPSFLATHRALSVCTRELELLAVSVVRGVAALTNAGLEEKSKERLSPGRCIVQLGPVALTITWLRSTIDSVADGDLLAIVWRGSVAPKGEHLPERMTTRHAPLAVTSLWEEVFVAAGTDQATWAWQLKGDSTTSYSSVDLAAQCVDRLRAAYEECRTAEAAVA
ncbi:MAG TPA: hypothetical protein VN607_04680 [Gemmatimonadaceae bacterium]|nr:hypothetical protein [Gemmatimonadaceae bacterium]